ncbi:MAG: BamA/TamA family outer membrane protein, partial [Planctomycetes bacterium]|nr:BamA/TamA family outer membrane protein [Planctomycetota bacterium]
QAPDGSQAEQVVQVRIIVNEKLLTRRVIPNIHTRAGRPFDTNVIEEDVRRLNQTGMFLDVKVSYQQVAGGRVVIFELLQRPRVRTIEYLGAESVSADQLAKETQLEAGHAVDPYAVEEAKKKIETFYLSKGFNKVRVTILEGNKPSDRDVRFLINEGPKQKIWWTNFVGNTIASDERLKTQIESTPGILWLFGGEVHPKIIEEDVKRITAYYRSLGFRDAKVSRELQFDRNQEWLTLTFVIHEGLRYRIRNVLFAGNKRFATAELASKVDLTPGDYFNQAEVTTAVEAIRNKYGTIGHVFADVNADLRYLDPETDEPGMLDLVIGIKEGDPYRVGRINVSIKGSYPHTRIDTILNRLSLRPGDLVDVRKLRADERRLQSSRLFNTAPDRGSLPQITFDRPNLQEEATLTARRRDGSAEVRGQSPDPRTTGPRYGQLDLTLSGQWADRPPSAPPVRQMARPPHAPRPAPSAPNAYPRPTYRIGQPPVARTIRGQYTPQAGQTSVAPAPVPSFTPPPSSLPPAQPSIPWTDPASGGVGATAELPRRMPPGSEGMFDNSVFADALKTDENSRYIGLNPMGEETETGRLMFGVGINSDAGLVGSFIVDEHNFDLFRYPRSFEDLRTGCAWRGGGKRFRFEAAPGTEVQRYMVSYGDPYLFEPYFLQSHIDFSVSGFFYDRRYREWDEQRTGGTVGLGYRFAPDLTGTLSFRGAKINVNDPIVPTPPELAEVVGDSTLLGFKGQLRHDTRDNPFLATSGHLLDFSFEQVVGSYMYPRFEVDMRKYFWFRQRADRSGRHVLSMSARFAWTGDDTPIYDHYFAGGFSTIRGFDFRGASPRNMGVAVGGHLRLLFSAEYSVPITADDNLRAVVFCDAGTVEETLNIDGDDFRVAPGFGLRISVPRMSPAPIALDFAFPIALEDGDQIENFQFFLGINR